jgi:two-component system response regulator DevR
MSEATIGVFILGEHEGVRGGLAALVASAPDLRVVGSAGTVEEALPLIVGNTRVVLLDVQPWDGAGVPVGRRVRGEHPDVRCILLTSFDDDDALFAAVMIGAVGYLVRRIGGDSLLDGIRAVAGGRTLLDGVVSERLRDRLGQSGQGDHRGANLDDHERQVLELISRGRTDQQIAEETQRSTAEVQRLVTGLHSKLTLPRQGLPGPSTSGLVRVGPS